MLESYTVLMCSCSFVREKNALSVMPVVLIKGNNVVDEKGDEEDSGA